MVCPTCKKDTGRIRITWTPRKDGTYDKVAGCILCNPALSTVLPFNYTPLNTRVSGAGTTKYGKKISAAHMQDLRSRFCQPNFSDPGNPTFEYGKRPKGKPIHVVMG